MDHIDNHAKQKATEASMEGDTDLKDLNSAKEDKEASMRNALFSKLSSIYSEYHLSAIQQFAVDKFMRDLVGDRNNDKVDRVRQWIVKKINGVKAKPIHEGQRGCPGIVPGLRAKPWW